MIQTQVFDKYVDEYEAWYETYHEVYLSEIETGTLLSGTGESRSRLLGILDNPQRESGRR